MSSCHYARWLLPPFGLLQHYPERVAFCQSKARSHDAALEMYVFFLLKIGQEL
jgi:hypothetical protein